MLRILAAVAVLTQATPASAQEVEPSETLTQIDYQAELDSINTEATAATVLYVISTVLLVGGAGAGIALAAIHGILEDDSSDAMGFGHWAMGMFAASGIGLFTLVTSIGLDVDSGKRRRALNARRPEGVELTSVSVTPTEGGAALQLGGHF